MVLQTVGRFFSETGSAECLVKPLVLNRSLGGNITIIDWWREVQGLVQIIGNFEKPSVR